MISLDDALQFIRSETRPLSVERVATMESVGRIVAKPVAAARTQPPFAASAMDGYAVRAQDLDGDGSELLVRGESAAGHASERLLQAGECQRISTGAPLPDGSDQIVIQENAKRQGDRLTTTDTPHPGRHIRRAGIDFTAGDTLLSPGNRITPRSLSLIVSAGVDTVDVYRRPQTGLLSTGDELVEPGASTRPDQIVNSLGPGLGALIRHWGGEPDYLGIARDDPGQVRSRLAAASGLDLLVTIGGASVGDHDHLRRVFADMGGELVFEKIAIKPGKPTWFGRLGGTHVLGLPGNPVSAMVMARLCLKPLMDGLLGQSADLPFLTARLSADLPANGPRENMIRAGLEARTGEIQPVSNQDSSALSALVVANALIRRPANAPAASAGDAVEYLPLDDM
ncbi:gephyrin-like molybdotransferase Glp [Hyphobacterium sp. HN65]|uniref:Molybdopterin molybdenumtransferase n=1 Tax=Hyphobacterium lacteum TaxID=3116575 RepID=A0ABU7LP51_9PROT|nr:gephyrin-like molybdotransferase Glp [Hyphobacterium sp. HN65]MEE2525698.1 gephyrin-like molybdotransferase Glp [Hyphobacterium sp. HN65]